LNISTERSQRSIDYEAGGEVSGREAAGLQVRLSFAERHFYRARLWPEATTRRLQAIIGKYQKKG
jgi:hypothetical protein